MKSEITQEVLMQEVFYDPLSGELRKIKKSAALPNKSTRGYLQISIRGTTCLVHRLAWLYCHGEWPKQVIDHIDGNRLNNKLENLRDVSPSVNNHNRNFVNCNNKAGVLGVNYHAPMGKWRARFKIRGVQKHIGYFDSSDAAHAAYLAAKKSAMVIGAVISSGTPQTEECTA